MKKLACALALASAFTATNALAWGNEGHRAVGAIADKLLKGSKAQKEIAALLLPGETLESLANWADCVKGSYCGPQSQEMIDYVAANPKHTEYHYTDVPFQLEHYHQGEAGTGEDDIVQTLKQCIAVLQGKTDPALNPHKFTKRQALIIMVHLVGDIHQPLHVGAAYVSKDGKFVVPATQKLVDGVNIIESRGGNNFWLNEEKVTAQGNAQIPGEKQAPAKNLNKPFHSYWDTTVVNYAFRRSSTKTPDQFAQAMIDARPAVPKDAGDVSAWPVQWADDALAASKKAFEGVTPGAAIQQTSKKGEVYYTWPMDVPENYPVPSSDLARTQLTKAGFRLAAALEAIYG